MNSLKKRINKLTTKLNHYKEQNKKLKKQNKFLKKKLNIVESDDLIDVNNTKMENKFNILFTEEEMNQMKNNQAKAVRGQLQQNVNPENHYVLNKVSNSIPEIGYPISTHHTMLEPIVPQTTALVQPNVPVQPNVLQETSLYQNGGGVNTIDFDIKDIKNKFDMAYLNTPYYSLNNFDNLN